MEEVGASSGDADRSTDSGELRQPEHVNANLEDRLDAAIAVLGRRSGLMRSFAARYGRPRLYRDSFDPGRSNGPTHQHAYGFLVETLIYQQLSGSSARAILARLMEAAPLEPEALLALGAERLRAIWLSAPKIRTLERLCKQVTPEELDQLSVLGDAAVRSFIVGLHGFGDWSADMYLMFHLHRFDVWPVGDLAMRRSVQRHLADGAVLSLDEVVALGDPFRPFRSLAAWYFWADDHAQGLGGARS
jgi:DNA-3-methyladenine glycosylase II